MSLKVNESHWRWHCSTADSQQDHQQSCRVALCTRAFRFVLGESIRFVKNLATTRALRFESIHRFVLGESIRFVKNSATQFGRYIRLINDHILMPIVPYSAVVYNSTLLSCYNWRHSRRLCEVVRVTHDDGVELTSDNIVNDSSLYAYTAVMCWIESKKIDSFWKIKLEYFFWIGMLYYVHC